MTARSRWRRAYGYARASRLSLAILRTGIGREWLAMARAHERHAWSRLPDAARKAVQP